MLVQKINSPSANYNQSDISFMLHALAIAGRAVGSTAPNPAVGCVLVKNGKILSAAHTAAGGRPHAETIALSEAGQSAHGATAYVTLEPCAHHGKTPPCAAALIKAGIKKVVIANIDPFLQVNGKGVQMLQNAGIEVITGVCAEQAAKLNAGFFKVQKQGRPFITLKTATSTDGKIAYKDGTSKWITGEQSREYVHLMRARNDAVITGIATIIADDPLFNCRLPGMEKASPVRVVLDSNLNIPIKSQLINTAKTYPCWVITIADSISSKMEKAAELEKLGAKIISVRKAGNGKVCMEDAMDKLAQNGINNAMIEAGANINTAALQLGLIDRIAWFKAPIKIGDDGIPAFKGVQIENLANNMNFVSSSYKVFHKDTLIILELQSEFAG